MKAATLLLAAALLYACGGSRHRVTVEAVADDCVQVLYFHGKQRCATCTAIERLTREVIDSIGSEKVVLRIIDIAENEALADRYQAGWSALILDRNGRVENLTRMGFSYAKDQPATFKARPNVKIILWNGFNDCSRAARHRSLRHSFWVCSPQSAPVRWRRTSPPSDSSARISTTNTVFSATDCSTLPGEFSRMRGSGWHSFPCCAKGRTPTPCKKSSANTAMRSSLRHLF